MVRRTKEEALATRNRILDAAEQVFYDKGVSRTSLADIAAHAGVTRGAIYWHFANKGDLFTAMFDRVLLPLDELTRPAEGEQDPDPLGRLTQALKWCLHMAASDPRRRRAFDILFLKCEFVEEMGPVKARHQASMEEGISKMETGLTNAVALGQLPADLDTRRGALFLHAFIGGCLRDSLLLAPGLAFGSHTEAFVDACLDMLRTSPALRRPTSAANTRA
ncbi:TetR family transcriptional regulator [Trinickia fusca]|uniref:TetR family transcriptional regulator n=1 Tax=Trinickia fusca TaxID=2419777 RepID=A0A494XLR7_9BURK|nr:TetR family transcriptional regulator [Trinickia fusca]RKP49059.1 TetR family transcriptional regulator [Trinickia fusca]